MLNVDFSLKGKVAVVTGGSRGIGRAISIALAEAGADVIPTSRNLKSVEEVTTEIEKLGRRSLAIATDVSDSSQVNQMVETVTREYGGIDILVNNAGISPFLKSAEQVTEDEWDAVISVNLKSVFLCSRSVGLTMIANQKGGVIVNIASVGGQVALPKLSAYCAAKGGILQLTRVCAVDWVKHNIRVNAVAPAYAETDLTEGIRGASGLYSRLINQTPMGRFASPMEIAGSVVFLASPAASYITGEVLFVDGGWHAV